MLATVLIVVTLGHADAPHLAVTPADDAAACAAKAGAVTAVLDKAGFAVAAARCVQTDQRFSAYRHGPDAPAPIHPFRVTLPARGGATVEALARLSDCDAAPDADPAVFCAVSAQTLID